MSATTLYDASRRQPVPPRRPGTRKGVLLTDGRDENSALQIDDGLVWRAATSGAVGVGQVDERVMRRIGKLTGGDYFPPGSGTAAVLAARIAAGPAAADAVVPRVAADQPSSRSSAVPPRDAAPRAAAPRTVLPAAAAAAAGSRRGLWIGPGVALVAAVALGWIALGQRSRALRDCRRPLPDRLSECAFCSREPATVPPPRAPAPPPPRPADRPHRRRRHRPHDRTPAQPTPPNT
jgi:hypothetical protein